MIKTVLFDLGNVIFLFSHEKMCEQIGALFHRSAEEIRQYLFHDGHLKRFETGQISEQQMQAAMEAYFGRRVELEALRLACSDIFEINEPVISLIHQLHAQGIRLVLLSNTSITHVRFLQQFHSVLQLFDDLVLSYEVGSMKPEPEIYQAALDKIHCSPEECLYTDDLQANIEGAIGFGLKTHLFTTAANLCKALEEQGVRFSFRTGGLSRSLSDKTRL